MRQRATTALVGAVSLFVREWVAGQPDEVPFVFWHALGSATSGAYLGEIAPLLVARHRLHLVAPDAPGFGHSPALERGGYTLEASVDLLAALLRRIGLDRPILAGHSWGGVVATMLAARPDMAARGLVLLDSGHLDYPDAPGFDPALTYEGRVAELSAPERRLPAVPWEEFADEIRAELPRWNPAIDELLRAGVSLEGGRVREVPTPEVKAAVMDALGRARVSDAWDAIAASGIPVLLLTATQPTAAASLNAEAASRYIARVPRTTWIQVDGARHDLLLDAGPQVADAIGAWLDAAGLARTVRAAGRAARSTGRGARASSRIGLAGRR